MTKYIIRRLMLLVPVLLGVTFLVFFIMELTPGDPVEIYLGADYSIEAYESIREELNLNKSMPLRYVDYVVNAVQGDLGESYTTKRPVIDEITARFPATLQLAAFAMLISILIGIPLGVIASVKQNSITDSVSRIIALLGVSMPNFWFGMMLILVFSAGLKILPSSGSGSLKYIILPAVTLSANALAMIARMTRSSMLETIRQDYIRTARAKGIKESVVIIKHALRNAMIPIITTIGLQFGFTMGGSVMVEMVFGWPGIGRLLVEAIKLKDTPIVLAVVVVMALSFTIINLLIDILYAFFDPRIKTLYGLRGK